MLVIDSFSGVEDVKAEMVVVNKLTVVGKVDVELISALPPKKDNKAAADDNKPDKKPKEVCLSANLRLSLSSFVL